GSVNNGASPLGLGVTYGQTLTEKDSLWEFDLNTKYQIYDELSAVVNMGYINADFDESVWTEIGNNNKEEDAAKVVVGVEYKF
ncbi:MAG: hypothetical protein KKB70_08880, partial [Proteobacteria bacterium]|nr:hypothetical protein [Pseudomonadota bacterium]MBU1611920.1 hypothetical protein [Pseudomonadota bacterium]